MVVEKELVVETVSLELICPTYRPESQAIERPSKSFVEPLATVKMYVADRWHDTPVYQRAALCAGSKIDSPAIIIEHTGTNIVEPGWQGEISDRLDLILTHKPQT